MGPYSRFANDITVVATWEDSDTRCPSEILNALCEGCEALKVVGWVDDASHVCHANRRRRRLRREGYGSARRLASSSSSSSSSDGGWRWWEEQEEEEEEEEPEVVYKDVPEEEDPVVPLSSSTSTGEPEYVAPEETPTPTVGAQEEQTTQAAQPIPTGPLCECASQESWDDFHYYDEDGLLVILQPAEQAQAEVVMVDAQIRSNVKSVSASDMQTDDAATRFDICSLVAVLIVAHVLA